MKTITLIQKRLFWKNRSVPLWLKILWICWWKITLNFKWNFKNSTSIEMWIQYRNFKLKSKFDNESKFSIHSKIFVEICDHVNYHITVEIYIKILRRQCRFWIRNIGQFFGYIVAKRYILCDLLFEITIDKNTIY